MSVWKKFASLLFEESDVDVIAEDELEDISFPEEELIPVKKTVSSPKMPEKAVDSTRDEKIEVPMEEKAKEETKKFVSIEISEEAPKQKEMRSSASTIKSRPMRSNAERVEKPDFEVTPVISPIFGSKEEQAKTKSSSVSITLPKPKRPNPLGTVISPYYGMGELEEFKAEAQETIQQKEKIRHEEPVESEDPFLDGDEDINPLSLDDLIMDFDQEDEEEDMMQISLFGESTPLRESDDEAQDIQKEV